MSAEPAPAVDRTQIDIASMAEEISRIVSLVPTDNRDELFDRISLILSRKYTQGYTASIFATSAELYRRGA